MGLPVVTISQEKLDQICQAFDRVLTVTQALEAIQKRQDDLEAALGKIPLRKGIPLPGHQWAGTESPRDAEDMKKQFLYWLMVAVSNGRTKNVVDDRGQLVEIPAEVRALSEGTDSAGGHLVPQIFIPELVRLIEERATMRRLVRKFPMVTDESKLPSLTTGMTVYWPGENVATTESDPVFGQVVLTAKTLAAMTSASLELTEDAQLALADILAALFAEAIADEEDKQILNGTGAPFTGILNDTGANVVTMPTGQDTFAETTFQDIKDLIGSVTTKAKRGGIIFLNRAITKILHKIRDLNHQYVWQPVVGIALPGNTQGPVVGRIDGYDVIESDQMPSTSAVSTKFIAFGNPLHTFLGDRRVMTVRTSDEVGFKTGTRFWKATERIAVKVGIPAAYGVLKTAAS